MRWRIALQTGLVISDNSYEEMTRVVNHEGFTSPFGQWALGLWVNDGSIGTMPRGIYNEGTGTAGNAVVASLPDNELIIAAITNGGSLGSEVMDMIIRVLVLGEAVPVQ